MKRFVRVALALTSAAMVVPTVLAAQAAPKPVVAVMYFENNSVGPSAKDYDGVGKGIAELMINEMLSNPNIRLVERERVQALITEQGLVKSGAIDPQTAIKLGKMLGVHYMIMGGFLAQSNGSVALTGRTVNVETSAISNPTRINSKGDDVIGMITQLTEKLNADMKLPALRTADAGDMKATPAGAPAADKPAAPATAAADKPAAATAAADKPVTKAAPAKATRKMDMKTAMLYSKALEAEDAGNKAQAVELYTKVNTAFPGYAPVTAKLSKLRA